MVLTHDEKDWIERMIEKDKNKLEIKKKLQENKFTTEKIEEMLVYYDSYYKGNVKTEEKRDIEAEKEFEGKVRKFLEGNMKDLSWGERREIKSFLKKVMKYNETLKFAIKGVKAEIDMINKRFSQKGEIDKELDFLKDELIDRIIDSKQILDITHPITGEEVNKENLKTLEMDDLIMLMEDNVDTLNMIVNGKIVEDKK